METQSPSAVPWVQARGASSAASAASAAIDHMRDWTHGTADGDWVSMAVPSDGSYGVKPGVIFGYPVTVKNGQYSIVQGLEIDAFSQARIDATDKELREERAAVEGLFPPKEGIRPSALVHLSRLHRFAMDATPPSP